MAAGDDVGQLRGLRLIERSDIDNPQQDPGVSRARTPKRGGYNVIDDVVGQVELRKRRSVGHDRDSKYERRRRGEQSKDSPYSGVSSGIIQTK